ncbi:MFS general substrate transporter [Zopfia rhizophila CBS 207.26]|uniref:MFS general substrate transporter n=1 Tax=Zopfia rhizophila CBS 207.26 TaxID=1314779 RepID=A0A6A6EHS1_9PEZI|nr:MFS general substrate transporter [Zopfia rhizophila CBS 207.26]
MSRSERSDSDTSQPGAAQFLHGLSPRQLQHLQFSVPIRGTPNRLSQFLEEPRRPPVPNRFTFDALDSRTKETSGRSRSSTRSSTRSETPTADVLLKELPKLKKIDWKSEATFWCLSLLNLVAAWNATSISVALPTIAGELHGYALQSFWLGTSFLLAATAFQPIYTSCSDIFGRKPMLLTALAFSTVGAFLAAVTGKFTGLLLGRSVQGIGGGGLYALTHLIGTDLVSAKDRSKWSNIIGAMWAVGAVTGPLIGGALAEYGQWRWIFWINLPFCGLAFVIIPVFAQLKTPDGRIREKLRKVDWLGFFLFTCSLISVLLALTWGGILHPWNSFRTTLPIQLGLVGFMAFLLWSRFSPVQPILRISPFMDLTSLVAYFGAVMQGMIGFSAIFFLPLYFEAAKNVSLVRTGVSMLPWTLALAIFALTTAVYIVKSRHYRPAIWLGWFLITLGVALMALFTRSSTTATFVGIAMVSGIGLGVLYPALSIASQAPAQNDNLPFAVTNYSFFQTLGQTLGVAVGGAIFQNQLHRQLLKNPQLERLAQAYAKDAVAVVQAIRAMPGGEGTLKTDLADAYVHALRPIWIVMAALAGVAFAVSFFTRALAINRTEEQECAHQMRTFDEER